MTGSLKRGFTLVELLVVVAIISFLSSIVYANLAVARGKSIDTRKVADMASVRTALTSFHIDNQTMPHNYDCSGGNCVVDDNRVTLAIEDCANPENPQTESGKAYRASMIELIGGGKYLTTVPHSPGGSCYTYYNYGEGSAAGAMVGTTLVAAPPTTEPYPNTCRPFAATQPGGSGGAKNFPPVPQEEAAAVGLAVGPIEENGHCTVIDENGNTQEYPLSDPRCGGSGGGGQTAPPNLCSQTNSQDYCICATF